MELLLKALLISLGFYMTAWQPWLCVNCTLLCLAQNMLLFLLPLPSQAVRVLLRDFVSSLTVKCYFFYLGNTWLLEKCKLRKAAETETLHIASLERDSCV